MIYEHNFKYKFPNNQQKLYSDHINLCGLVYHTTYLISIRFSLAFKMLQEASESWCSFLLWIWLGSCPNICSRIETRSLSDDGGTFFITLNEFIFLFVKLVELDRNVWRRRNFCTLCNVCFWRFGDNSFSSTLPWLSKMEIRYH